MSSNVYLEMLNKSNGKLNAVAGLIGTYSVRHETNPRPELCGELLDELRAVIGLDEGDAPRPTGG